MKMGHMGQAGMVGSEKKKCK